MFIIDDTETNFDLNKKNGIKISKFTGAKDDKLEKIFRKLIGVAKSGKGVDECDVAGMWE